MKGITVGRASDDTGWRWSEHVVGADPCAG